MYYKANLKSYKMLGHCNINKNKKQNICHNVKPGMSELFSSKASFKVFYSLDIFTQPLLIMSVVSFVLISMFVAT